MYLEATKGIQGHIGTRGESNERHSMGAPMALMDALIVMIYIKSNYLTISYS